MKGRHARALHQRALKTFRGAPTASRTPNLTVKNRLLGHIELWGHGVGGGRARRGADDILCGTVTAPDPVPRTLQHIAVNGLLEFGAYPQSLGGAGKEPIRWRVLDRSDGEGGRLPPVRL